MEENLNYEKGKVGLPSDLLVLQQGGQVILHGTAKGFRGIQLHNNTHLVCYKNHKESKLLFCFGIPTYPNISEEEDQKFTLIFEGLPENCSDFYFQSVPSGGTWKSYNFSRIAEDCYQLEIE